MSRTVAKYLLPTSSLCANAIAICFSATSAAVVTAIEITNIPHQEQKFCTGAQVLEHKRVNMVLHSAELVVLSAFGTPLRNFLSSNSATQRTLWLEKWIILPVDAHACS